MRSKLQKFTDFAGRLLPHETGYLLDIQHFDDKVKLAILQRADHNCRRPDAFIAFDEGIDKRKYSNLKQWMIERLRAIDVDEQHAWLLEVERQIETDRITPEAEARLLELLAGASPPDFHFVKLYELARYYRHFLLIRMRYADHRTAEEFLERHRGAYERAVEVREQLHRATLDIVRQYSGEGVQSLHWENWLNNVFYDEALDGWNRYMALVRLTFIYYNYRNFEPLREKYDYQDALFRKGQYYSSRLLTNYYGNRLLLHIRFQEFDEAEYYGYLSIRVKTADYIHYVNNLCTVLLRRKKYAEALAVMKTALPESKTTHSFHNKIGFVAAYLRCLNYTGQHRAAENYAETYLRAYRREIFEHRWHAFFTAYIDTLLAQKNYAKALRVIEKNKLLEHDAHHRGKSYYLPAIPCYHALSAYKIGRLTHADLKNACISAGFATPSEKNHQAAELSQTLRQHVPDIF
ncbi:MAG: hypothetical protein IT259_06160 [Saprospiraceae bacterium]|nr:hypothetical protein [Saprospiraceae bacterium]